MTNYNSHYITENDFQCTFHCHCHYVYCRNPILHHCSNVTDQIRSSDVLSLDSLMSWALLLLELRHLLRCLWMETEFMSFPSTTYWERPPFCLSSGERVYWGFAVYVRENVYTILRETPKMFSSATCSHPVKIQREEHSLQCPPLDITSACDWLLCVESDNLTQFCVLFVNRRKEMTILVVLPIISIYLWWLCIPYIKCYPVYLSFILPIRAI